MKKGGRPRTIIWEHFTEIIKDGKRVAECRICKHSLLGKPDRMKTHYNKCLEKQCMQPTQSRKRERSSSPAPAAPPSKQTKVDTNFVRATSDLKDELDMDIARLFNSCDIPLDVADSHYFKATWKRARPGYTPPSRTKLADQLLPKMHAEQTQQMNSDVGNQAALVQDRESSIHNDSNNATSSQEERRSYFFDRTDQGSATNITDYCDESRFIKIFVSLVHGL